MKGDRRIAVIGLGYVGLPLAQAISDAELRVIGIDIDPERVRMLPMARAA